MTQAASLSLQPGVQAPVMHHRYFSPEDEVILGELNRAALVPDCLSLVIEYSGDFEVCDRVESVRERSYKLVLDAFRGSKLLSRFTAEIPQKLPPTEREKRVRAIYRFVMDLARAHTIQPGVLKILDESPMITPLRLLPLVMELAKPVEDADLGKIFLEIVGKIQRKHPEARDFLRKIESLPSAAKAEAILGFMNEHRNWLEEIEKLNLNNLKLSTLPPQIAMLPNLQRLWLTTNELTVLPAEIGQLAHLKLLELQINQLTSLPDAVGKLLQLQTLSLSVNKLTSLLAEIGLLVNLQYLRLGQNQLSSLPDATGQLVNLRDLGVDDNQLTSLPDLLKLTKLKQLFIAGNKLTSQADPILQQLRSRGCTVYSKT